MSEFNAFVCEEYYDAWATVEVGAGRQPTQLRFLQEFGTPYLYYSQGGKKSLPNYITIPPGIGIRINFNYFSELGLRFPDISYVDPNIKYIENMIKPITTRMYTWVSKFFQKASKSSAVAPITS
jgi:hypothetical protein